MTGPDLAAAALREPESMMRLDATGWDRLISQARHAGILARLATKLDERGLFERVPEAPRRHLDGMRIFADRLAKDVRWEVRCLREALGSMGVPFVLLKGAAYVAAGLPAARGRIFSDVDFMVPREEIERVELNLRGWGWLPLPMNPYDQRYYREWSHQIPPMVHVKRGTTIDIHHTIIPETARTHVERARVAEAAVALDAAGDVRILAPEDMVLHSAVHLINEGEFDAGLRDLSDIAELIRHFSADEGFWPRLAERTETLGLTRPTFYALRQIERLFGVAPPEAVAGRIARWAPSPATLRLMDVCLAHAMLPTHPSCETRFAPLARWLLFVRGHYLRMPFGMLIPHLVRKTVARLRAGPGRPA